jgi:hypothetical protein
MATTGFGLSQPPVALMKTADAITQKYVAPVLADAVMKPSPSFWRMTRLGKKLQGGGSIVWPVLYTEETSGGAYWGTQVLDTAAIDSVQPAELQWTFYNQPITIPYTDVLLNSGSTGVLDLIKLKEETAMASFLQKLSRALYGVAPQNTSLDISSIVDAVHTATNTYAGINRSTAGNEFWKPGGTNQANRTASGNLNMTDLLTAYGDVVFGNEEPDTCITTQAAFNAFEILLIGNQRYARDEDTVRAGFRRHLMLNNAIVLHDQYAPSGTWTYLNTKYIYPAFHQDDYFVVDPFIRPTNQRVLSSFIWLTWQMKCLNPRMHQALKSITNG